MSDPRLEIINFTVPRSPGSTLPSLLQDLVPSLISRHEDKLIALHTAVPRETAEPQIPALSVRLQSHIFSSLSRTITTAGKRELVRLLERIKSSLCILASVLIALANELSRSFEPKFRYVKSLLLYVTDGIVRHSKRPLSNLTTDHLDWTRVSGLW